MRRLTLLSAALIVLPLLGSDSAKDYHDTVVTDSLEGVWRPVEIELNGVRQPFPPVTAAEYTTYRRGHFTWPIGFEGSYTNDPGSSPAHLDEVLENGAVKGQRLKKIYEVRGDTLRVAVYPGGAERPNHFSEKDLVTHILKRVR